MSKLEPVNNLDDVFYYTAKKHGKDVKQIEFIYKQLFKAVKYYLSRPHLCGSGLNIKNFIKYRFREGAIRSYYYRLLDEQKANKIEESYLGTYNKQLSDLEYYEKLLEMIESHKETEKSKNG